MKKIIGIIVVLALIVIIGLSANRADSLPDGQSNNRKIVVLLPLSGPIAYTGELAKRGVEMAVADLGEDRKVEVVFEDQKNDPKVAVSIFNEKMASGDTGAYVTIGSPIAMSLLPLALQNKVVLMSVASTPKFVSDEGYVFKLNGSSNEEVKSVIKNMEKMSVTRLAILYQNDDYGLGLANSIKSGYAKPVVAEEGFVPGSNDVRTSLTKIKAANPDLIFIAAYAPFAGIIAKQADSFGLKAKFMCGSACDITDLIKVGGSSVEGYLITGPTNVTSDDFLKKYQSLYNDDLNYVTTRNYDAVMMLAKAMDSCDKASEYGTCMKDAIHSFKNFPGTSFGINFDKEGNINDTFIVKKVVNGKFEVQQ